MTALAVNERNDLYLDDTRNLATVSGIYQTLQQCEQAIKAQLGEMVLAMNRGMPTLETVWLAQDIPRWEAAAYVALQRVPGVTEILALVSEVVSGELRYNVVIRTIYGEGSISG